MLLLGYPEDHPLIVFHRILDPASFVQAYHWKSSDVSECL